MMLTDLGAETIKIEPLGGEGTRALLARDPANSVDGMGAYFLTLNRSKKSVALDLKKEEGLALFYELVKKSDVVLYNFAAGVAERLKIDHASLSEVNPRVVTCSITGFGETGPNKDWVSFDMVAQGTGGGMSITGVPGGEPLRAGIPIGDIGGGMMATIGVLAALQARHASGVGRHVDVSMQDTQISMLSYMATMHMLSGEVPRPTGNGHFVHVPYGTYRARDGWIIIAGIQDDAWKGVVRALDLGELDVEEHLHQPGRLRNKARIDGAIAERLRAEPRAHWLEKLRAERVPCAPVNDVAEALRDPHVLARDMVVEVPTHTGRTVKLPGNPVKISDHEDSYGAPPRLGEHTREVLAGLLGLSPERIEALAAAETVKCG
jgi:crotonobetainyl-CoA:carnitine CoA-transferase CaiB-like acyl-CoA transferase